MRDNMGEKKTCVILMAGILANPNWPGAEKALCMGEECVQYTTCQVGMAAAARKDDRSK